MSKTFFFSAEKLERWPSGPKDFAKQNWEKTFPVIHSNFQKILKIFGKLPKNMWFSMLAKRFVSARNQGCSWLVFWGHASTQGYHHGSISSSRPCSRLFHGNRFTSFFSFHNVQIMDNHPWSWQWWEPMIHLWSSTTDIYMFCQHGHFHQVCDKLCNSAKTNHEGSNGTNFVYKNVSTENMRKHQNVKSIKHLWNVLKVTSWIRYVSL